MSVGKPKFTFLAHAELAQQQRLNEAAIRRFAASADSVYCEPKVYDLAATEIQFSLSGTMSGRYVRHNARVDLWFSVVMNAPAVGASMWTMEMPDGISLTGGLYDFGTWTAERPSTNAVQFGTIQPSGIVGRVQFAYSAAGTKTMVGPSAPWTWATGDVFAGHVTGFV